MVGSVDPQFPDVAQAAVLDAARALSSSDLRVQAVLLSAPGAARGGPADSGATRQSTNARLHALGSGLSALLADERPDVLHTVSGMAGLAALAVAPRSTALVHSPGGRVVRGGAADDLARLERLLLSESRRVVAASNAEADTLISLGLQRERVDVVPYGIDPSLFSPDGPSRLRQPGLARVVTLSRRLDERSGVDGVLRALRGSSDVELVVAGGPPRDRRDADPQVRRLRALAQELHLADRVHFEGFLAHADVPALLRSADVVVVPPRWGATGAVAVEAMACGRPVVTTTLGADAEAVVEGTTGVVVDAEEPDALRRALLELLADPMRRSGYSMAAVHRVAARHDWDSVRQRLMDAYVAACPPPALTLSRPRSGGTSAVAGAPLSQS